VLEAVIPLDDTMCAATWSAAIHRRRRARRPIKAYREEEGVAPDA